MPGFQKCFVKGVPGASGMNGAYGVGRRANLLNLSHNTAGTKTLIKDYYSKLMSKTPLKSSKIGVDPKNLIILTKKNLTTLTSDYRGSNDF